MCYCVYLATTCEEKPVSLDPDRYSFENEVLDSDRSCVSLLTPPFIWHLLSFNCCSCHFRHTAGSFHPTTGEEYPPTFEGKANWCPEDEDDIEATGHVYDVLAELLAKGHRVEVIDFWIGSEPEAIETIEVSLSAVPRDHFRFFEGYRFVLRP